LLFTYLLETHTQNTNTKAHLGYFYTRWAFLFPSREWLSAAISS